MPKILRTYEDRLNYSRALAESFSQEMSDLTAQLRSGEIDLRYWQITMREYLRKDNALQLVTAAGGDVANVDPNDWLRLGSELQKQYRFLEAFANEIKDGTVNDAMLEARAALYAKSSQAAFWRQLTKGIDLPAMPCDGSSQCLGNCGCSWVEKDNGWSWELGKTDNCEDCLRRAGEWDPYVVGTE